MSRLHYRVIFPLLFILALIGYCLPWVITSASSLSLGAYDLAEWSSLHPSVRQSTPFLWTALALRIPLATLGILIAVYLCKTLHHTSIAMISIFVTAIALLPPLEFFTTFREDPNYRQGLIIALLTIIIGIAITIEYSSKLQKVTLIALSLLGGLSSAIGLFQAQSLMRSFGLSITIGTGGVMTIAAFMIAAYLHLTKQSSQMPYPVSD